MANRRRSFNRGFARGERRKTEWFALSAPTGVSTLAASSKAIVTSLTTVEKAKLPFTVIRTIGLLTVLSDQIILREVPSGALGATVVTDRARTVGITALPDPVTESEADFWFLFEPWSCIMQVDGTPIVTTSSPWIKVFDSKAQRKVEEGEDVVFIIANADSASGVFNTVQLRMLIKLH